MVTSSVLATPEVARVRRRAPESAGHEACRREDVWTAGTASLSFRVVDESEEEPVASPPRRQRGASCSAYDDESESCVYVRAARVDVDTGEVVVDVGSGASLERGPKDSFVPSTSRSPSSPPVPHRSFARFRAGEVAGPTTPGILGVVAFDAPSNILHVAVKLFQLWHAYSDASLSASRREPFAILPLTCDDLACAPAFGGRRTAAALWFDGMVDLLFRGAARVATRFRDAPHADVVLVPGESRTLFRGPRDARRFRYRAREHVGLSPLAPRPGKTVFVVQRTGTREIANLDDVVSSLRTLAPPDVAVRVFRPETLPFRDLVRHLSDAGLVVFAHGAFQANLVFLPDGAAAIELKQYGEFTTQPRDLAAAAHLHHAAVRARAPPASARVKRGCAPKRSAEINGAPADFCNSMSWHSPYNLTVDLDAFAKAATDALYATGLLHMPCECDEDCAETPDDSYQRLFWNDAGDANRNARARDQGAPSVTS